MTCREKLKIEHPEYINEIWAGGCFRCPSDYEYLPKPEYCPGSGYDTCERCWDREIPEKTCIDEYVEKKAEKIDKNMIYAHMGFSEEQTKEIEEMNEGKKTPNDIRDTLGLAHILDSGARREFESGAVRDIQEGKGRCDLLPMDVAAEYLGRFCIADGNLFDNVLHNILLFQNSGKVGHLYLALNYANPFPDAYTMILEVAKQFEEGAKKYGERNWEKGIPVHCYIDSAIRHYLKYKRGDKDEPHDRAVCWNLMCAIWTCKHKPELNEYAAENKEN